MTAGIRTPQGFAIITSIIDSLKLTKKGVSANPPVYHYAPDLVIDVPGVSPKWFDNPDWGMVYYVVAPELVERGGLRCHPRVRGQGQRSLHPSARGGHARVRRPRWRARVSRDRIPSR